jgi:hypothetical protein
MNRTKVFVLIALSLLWVGLCGSGTPARAYFCGDPLTDNCSVPSSNGKDRSGKTGNPVQKENHPTAVFVLQPGKTLKDNFEAWAGESGWKVIWKSEYTFPVAARYTAGRSFLGAVRRTIRIFNRSSGGWLRAKAFTTNHVLLVEDGR